MKKPAQNQKIVEISLPTYIAGICFFDAEFKRENWFLWLLFTPYISQKLIGICFEAEFKMLRAMPFV